MGDKKTNHLKGAITLAKREIKYSVDAEDGVYNRGFLAGLREAMIAIRLDTPSDMSAYFEACEVAGD